MPVPSQTWIRIEKRILISLYLLLVQTIFSNALGEDHIICFGELPSFASPEYGFYGSSVAISTRYTDLTSLCASPMQHRLKLIQHPDGSTTLEVTGKGRTAFGWNIGLQCIDRELQLGWNTPSMGDLDRGHFHAVMEYCKLRCLCRETWIALLLVMNRYGDAGLSQAFAIGMRSKTLETISSLGNHLPTLPQKVKSDCASPSILEKCVAELLLWFTNPGSEEPANPLPVAIETSTSQCGIDCTNFRCADRGIGCRCLASQWSEGVWREAKCGIPRLLGGLLSVGSNGKRNENSVNGLFCPCNQTYVSRACCNVDNGFVWEDPAMRMGSLQA